MAYRKRYWIDAAGNWRDRHNHNRQSTGPKGHRKVDRRTYRVRKPEPWKPPAPKPEKPPAPKPEKPSEAADLLKHTSPREFKSPFRFFLESVDNGHPNQIKTCYIILKVTSTSYISKRNPKGERVYAKKWGDITLAEARRMTIADLSDNYKYDTDWHPHIRALKGVAIKNTPSKGDDTRRELARTKLGRRKRKPKK